MDLRGVKCVMIAMLLFYLAGCVPGGLPIVEITDDINVTTTWEGGSWNASTRASSKAGRPTSS